LTWPATLKCEKQNNGYVFLKLLYCDYTPHVEKEKMHLKNFIFKLASFKQTTINVHMWKVQQNPKSWKP